MLRALFVLGFGSAPLWAAIVLVWFFSRQLTSPDYWNVAPWLIVVALPLCAVTTAIALATVGAYSFTKGTLGRKLGIAVACFALLTGAVSLLVYQQWREKKNIEKVRASDDARVVSFVAQHPAVLAAVGRPGRVSTGVSIVDAKGLATQYDVGIEGKPPVSAIVSVTRTGIESTFSLRCITTIPLGQRESHADWCSASTLPIDPKGAK